MEPVEGLKHYRPNRVVRAGEITEVVAAGCYVKDAHGNAALRLFDPGMTSCYQPKPGDFWIVYEDSYQAISPRHSFEAGYVPTVGVP
jgi:hypothetical protein